MKNQELHDLKTNELERFADQIKPFFEKYSSVIYAAAGASLLLVVGIIYFKYKEPANTEECRSFYTAAHSDSKKATQSYAALAEDYPNTIVGKWSVLKQADGALNDGLRLLFIDHKAAKKSIKQAGINYNKLIEGGTVSNDITERALFGLARVAEASCDGNTDEAIKQYERLTEQFPKSMYTPFAKARIVALGKNQTREFYAWFSQKNPVPLDRKGINDAIDKKPLFPLPSNHPPLNSSGGPLFPDGNTNKKDDDKKSDSKKAGTTPDENPFPKKTSDKKEEAGKSKKEGDNPFNKETTQGKPTNKKTTDDKTKSNPKPNVKKSPDTTKAPSTIKK